MNRLLADCRSGSLAAAFAAMAVPISRHPCDVRARLDVQGIGPDRMARARPGAVDGRQRRTRRQADVAGRRLAGAGQVVPGRGIRRGFQMRGRMQDRRPAARREDAGWRDEGPVCLARGYGADELCGHARRERQGTHACAAQWRRRHGTVRGGHEPERASGWGRPRRSGRGWCAGAGGRWRPGCPAWRRAWSAAGWRRRRSRRCAPGGALRAVRLRRPAGRPVAGAHLR